MKEYRILVYIDSVSGVSYHRLLLPYQKLAKTYENLHIDFVANSIKQEHLLEIVSAYDAFVFSRNFDIYLLKQLKSKITLIDDIDDWWELDRSHGLYYQFKYCGIADNMKDCALIADYITTTTHYLAEKIKHYNNNVIVFDNALEPFGQYVPKSNKADRIRFGIIGSSSHNNDMNLLRDITKYIPKHLYNRIQFVLCGFDSGRTTIFDASGNSKVEQSKWEDVCWVKWEKYLTNDYKLVSKDYADYLQKYDKEIEEPDVSNEIYRRIWSLSADTYAIMFDEIDVLIVPLLDTPFNACKSELKMVEASVKGKCVIISNVQPYKNYIDNGVNCIGVKPKRGAQGFAEAIVKLVNNTEMIEQMATQLSKLTEPESYFNLSVMTEKRYEWLANILQ